MRSIGIVWIVSARVWRKNKLIWFIFPRLRASAICTARPLAGTVGIQRPYGRRWLAQPCMSIMIVSSISTPERRSHFCSGLRSPETSVSFPSLKILTLAFPSSCRNWNLRAGLLGDGERSGECGLKDDRGRRAGRSKHHPHRESDPPMCQTLESYPNVADSLEILYLRYLRLMYIFL